MAHDRDRRLEEHELERIKDVAEQIDLLAHLLERAADPVHVDQRPRPLNLSVPAPGLGAMLRAWNSELLAAVDVLHGEAIRGPRA